MRYLKAVLAKHDQAGPVEAGQTSPTRTSPAAEPRREPTPASVMESAAQPKTDPGAEAAVDSKAEQKNGRKNRKKNKKTEPAADPRATAAAESSTVPDTEPAADTVIVQEMEGRQQQEHEEEAARDRAAEARREWGGVRGVPDPAVVDLGQLEAPHPQADVAKYIIKEGQNP